MELKNFFAQDDQGNALPNALCYLYLRGTESDVVGMQQANGVVLRNPFPADANGRIQFAAPSGLYDLRVVSGKRDYRINIQLNDVSADVAAAQAAAALAEAARDVALLEAGAFKSTAEGLAHTSNGEEFQVLNPTANDYLIIYTNQNGVAVERTRYPTNVALNQISKLVKGPATLSIANEEAGLAVSDEEGGEILLVTSTRLSTPAFAVDAAAPATGIYDQENGAPIHFGENEFSIGPLMFFMTKLPGIYVVDEENNILQDLTDPGDEPESLTPKSTDPLAGGAYFAPKVVTAPGVPLHLDVSSMIAPREDNLGVVATISSNSTAESISSTRELVIQAAKFGPTARLKLRDPNNALSHHIMDLSLTELQAGPFLGAAPNVLMIGDSISNRQGGQLLAAALKQAGYAANFIGTLPGSADPENPADASGLMGECREAYATGNYTYADLSAITLPVAPGSEAQYLALSKVSRRDYNPFIRLATGGDDPLIVRNGYVLDFAFYQSRFSLPTPDVIVYMLGMNDFIQVTNGAALNAYIQEHEKLMMQRIRVAWPNVKILRCLPGLPFQKTRNQQWTDRYIPMIRGVMSNLNALNDPKNILVPSWTFANPETGYKTGTAPVDAVTGISIVEISDNTHPIGANRLRLFQSIAPYIAAAKLNLI